MTTPLGEALAEYRSALGAPPPDRPAAGGRRWRGWAAVALALLVAVGGVWSAMLRSGAPQPGETNPVVGSASGSASTAPAPEPSASPAAPTHSGAPAQSGVLMVAPTTRWRAWSTSALDTWLPLVDGAGPRDGDPGVLTGFAHSPQGALAAAGSLLPAIYYTRDRAAWRWLARERVMWADGARGSLESAMVPVWSVHSGLVLRPVGFRMLSYSPQRAAVRLWWRTERPTGEQTVVGAIATVAWAAGDWWLVFDEPAMDLRPLDPGRDGYWAWVPDAGGAA